MKKAILFGSSGFIGSFLLQELLNDANYEQVTIVVRRQPGISHPKLKVLMGDYHSLPNLEQDIIADEVFITLGTTKKNTPRQDEYYQADHDYPVLAATIARQNGASSIFIVTAVGANANSNIFYIKTKGETERDIIALKFNHTHIFRPSMIMGTRKEKRPLEKIFIKLWSVINPVLAGGLSKYKGITGASIAKAMISAARLQSQKLKIYHWEEMMGLLDK